MLFPACRFFMPALLAICLFPTAGRCQEPVSLSSRKVPAIAVEAPPKIDGDPSDPAWERAAKAELFSDSFSAATNIDQTEARICYDETAIYVLFHCRDSQPDKIVGREIRRDAEFQGEDVVTFVLDPYRARRHDDINYFTTNPLGTPSSEIAGGRGSKAEWKGEWQSAARRVEDGWVAEMAIPWQILNFPTSASPLTMGINFMRRQERTKIFSYWSNITSRYQLDLAGDWEEVRVPKNAFRRRLSLLPFTTSRFNLGRGEAVGLGIGRTRWFNVGLDARMALTPELTAVATLNPDFSIVERAVEGIDFTRGERFVPDTRPFFLEGEEVFEVNVNQGRGWGEAFYSGRIPAFDAGTKLYGRYGPRDSIGFLGTTNISTDQHDVVGRWMHDIGPGSFAGGYLVQHSRPGDHNTVFGANTSILKGPWRVRADLTGSAGTDAGGSAANAGFRWSGKRLSFGAAYNRISSSFRAANGFVPFTDFQGPDFYAGYETEWRKGPFRSLESYVTMLDHRRTDGRFFRRLYGFENELTTRGDWEIRAGWEGGQFEDERDSAFTIGLTRNVSNRYNRIGLDYTFGKRADEQISFIAPFISKRLFGSWDFSVASALLRHEENESLHIISFNREFDQYRALGGRILIRDGYVHYFVSYRVSGGRGMETYFLIGDPAAETKHGRTYFMTKFVFPMSL